MKKIDVTNQVRFDNPDDELLPIWQCVCGMKYPVWNFVVGIYEDTARECTNYIKVYQLIEEGT